MSLDEIRLHIDAVDTQVKKLFLERMDCAQQVAQEKAKTGGDVFVQSREDAIIAGRTADVAPERKAEYAYFLLLLMSISRRYQYGLLPAMRQQVLEDLSSRAGLELTAAHTGIEVSFTCASGEPKLALFANMAALNGITVSNLTLTAEGETQHVRAALQGNAGQENMQRLLCQLGKELNEFALTGLC